MSFLASAICCLEPSTLPEHEGRRVVVLRVLRLSTSGPLAPVPLPNGAAYPLSELRPREGELFMTMRRGKIQPWSVEVDRERKGSKVMLQNLLKILYENAELYGMPPEPFI